MYECKKSDQYDTADVPTFEEVALYQRQPNEKYRLIILVGKYRLFVKLHPTFFFFFFFKPIAQNFCYDVKYSVAPSANNFPAFFNF